MTHAGQGRNESCACGSGRKFKHCCGRQGAQPAPQQARGAAGKPLLLREAATHLQAGALSRAEAVLLQLLSREPEEPDALHLLGLVAHGLGRHERAAELIRGALARRPTNPAFLCNLATVLLALGRCDEAAACGERALALKPGDPSATNVLGVSRIQQGRLDEARACFERVLRSQPLHATALYNLGLVELKSGRPIEALELFERSLRSNPRNAQALNDSGAALRILRRIDESAVRFEAASTLRPDFADAHFNLGLTRLQQSRIDEALACLARSEAIRPDPRNALLAATALPALYDSAEEIETHRQRFASGIAALMQRDLTFDEPLAAALGPSFFLAYHGKGNRSLQEALAALYLKAFPSLDWRALPDSPPGSRGGRVRIGFLSDYFRDHTVGDVIHGLIERIDRSRFEVTVFRFPGPADPLSERIDRAADRVVVLQQSLAEARGRIAAAALDALIYPEIGMHPATYFLAFGRYAPVQCAMWGHPDTTGIPSVDYYISAAAAEPEGAEEDYSETLVRLSSIAAYYERPVWNGESPSLEQIGLPADARLYLCPQTLYKFHPEFDAVLGALLRRDEGGVLVLFHGHSRAWSDILSRRFERAFPDAIGRVRFVGRLPKQQYFGLLQRAHAVIDTLHFGGGNTSYQAFGLGVPVVTWRGRHARGRFTQALYAQMGFSDLVADDADSFVELAFRLANDSPFRAAMVEKIRLASAAIFDNRQVVREFEEFLISAVDSARGECAGGTPSSGHRGGSPPDVVGLEALDPAGGNPAP